MQPARVEIDTCLNVFNHRIVSLLLACVNNSDEKITFTLPTNAFTPHVHRLLI